VTHRTSCSRMESSQVNAQALTRRSIRILENPASDIRHIVLAVSSLSRLISTGWLDYNKCVRRIYESPATQRMDRLMVEDLIDRWIVVPARA
jgi:hypothetical protein